MLAGTLEIIWLKRILQMYSWPETFVFKKSLMAGLLHRDDEKTKKQKNVSKRT